MEFDKRRERTENRERNVT